MFLNFGFQDIKCKFVEIVIKCDFSCLHSICCLHFLVHVFLFMFSKYGFQDKNCKFV